MNRIGSTIVFMYQKNFVACQVTKREKTKMMAFFLCMFLKIMFVLCMFMKMMMVFVLLYKYQDWADLLLILKRLFEITCFQVQGHLGFHHYSSTSS